MIRVVACECLKELELNFPVSSAQIHYTVNVCCVCINGMGLHVVSSWLSMILLYSTFKVEGF